MSDCPDCDLLGKALEALHFDADRYTEFRSAARKLAPVLAAYEVACSRGSMDDLRRAKEDLISLARIVALIESGIQAEEEVERRERALKEAAAREEAEADRLAEADRDSEVADEVPWCEVQP